jgi:hypothetical protein
VIWKTDLESKFCKNTQNQIWEQGVGGLNPSLNECSPRPVKKGLSGFPLGPFLLDAVKSPEEARPVTLFIQHMSLCLLKKQMELLLKIDFAIT